MHGEKIKKNARVSSCNNVSTITDFSSNNHSSVTVISNLHIFLSVSFSFLLLTGWCLFCPYICFLPPLESRNVLTHFEKCTLRFAKSWETWLPEPNVVVHPSSASCFYRPSMTIKTLYYPTDAQIYNS